MKIKKLKEYLKENLKVHLDVEGTELKIVLKLEDEVISETVDKMRLSFTTKLEE